MRNEIAKIEQKIHIVRGQKIMLSMDLAELYGVQPKVLLQAVKRNRARFPEDFMFQLTKPEAESSRSQIVTLKKGQNIKHLPYAFTEQGVAMLSSVLRSKRAIDVNIAIMRAFVRLRQFLKDHKELAEKLKEVEVKFDRHDQQIKVIFEAIRRMMIEESKPNVGIGFK